MKLKNLAISTKTRLGRAGERSMEPLDLKLEGHFGETKKIQKDSDTESYFRLYESAEYLREFHGKEKGENELKSHDNTEFCHRQLTYFKKI